MYISLLALARKVKALLFTHDTLVFKDFLIFKRILINQHSFNSSKVQVSCTNRHDECGITRRLSGGCEVVAGLFPPTRLLRVTLSNPSLSLIVMIFVD